MVINNDVSVHYNGGFLPDIILLIQCYYHHRGTRLNATKQPTMPIEDRLFCRRRVRSAMATTKGIHNSRHYVVSINTIDQFNDWGAAGM